MSTVEFDLYEFPKGYVGRKTYVHVEGHKRSIPVIYTYTGTDRRNHLRPDFGGTWDHAAYGAGPMIMSDITPYRSPIDGAAVTSRSAHRDHMRAHGVIEVGNERIGRTETPIPEAKTDIRKAISMLNNGYRPETRQAPVPELRAIEGV